MKTFLGVITAILTFVSLAITILSKWIGIASGVAYLVSSIIGGGGVFLAIILGVLVGVGVYALTVVVGLLITSLLAAISNELLS